MAKKSVTKKSVAKKSKELKTLNETGNRKETDRRSNKNTPVAGDRRKGHRRRQIDPTTCERDYNGSEIEFMRAMDEYKRRSGRPFPTWSEVLEVVHSLGYRQVAEATEIFPQK